MVIAKGDRERERGREGEREKEMATHLATARLRKELKSLQKEPVDNIRALPRESNILEWHYVIEGGKDTPYEGGWYHGIIKFPKEYPFKPPSIEMLTPNGRFKTNTKLCLSMSDFHPETWNPLWSVANILTGLYSFMLEEGSTYGSIVTPTSQKEQAAKASLAFNVKSKLFAELFPELVELHEKQEAAARGEGNKEGGIDGSSSMNKGSAGAGAAPASREAAGQAAGDKEGVGAGANGDSFHSWLAVLTVLAVVVAASAALIVGSADY